MKTDQEIAQAVKALRFIIPTIERYKFRWVITGGFAAYVYGVKRPITDIDIDIDTNVETPEFKKLVKELEPYTTQPLEHWTDQNYDNYNFEITYHDQVIDICPSENLKIINKNSGEYEAFYKTGFPPIETVEFHGIKLPLLPKDLIIKNKEMLVWQRELDLKDIEELRKMI